MKIKNQIRILSSALAIIAAVTLLPLTTLTVNAVDNSEPEIYSSTDTESKNVEQSDTCSSGTVEETETAINEETEEETEEFCEEFEVEDSAISAPPMTQIGDVADPNALTFLPDGVYAIENVGNDNYYMSVEGGYTVAGYNMVQEKYSSGTPLTDFSRVSLFKISRVGNTNQYVIRSMLNNRMSPMPGSDVDANKFITGYVNTDDASVTTTYTIMGSEGVYSIRPYGNMNVLAAPNTTASGSGNSTEAQLILTTQSAAGDRGKWKFTAYTGSTKYGFILSRPTSMPNGLVKGNTKELNLKGWSTVIGANTTYLSVTSATSSMASIVWNANSSSATITGLKCGDFKIKAEIRSGSSQIATHSGTYSYTVIPDIVGDTAFIQNVATEKYAEIAGASKQEGAAIQHLNFHGEAQMKWKFELGGNGYFKIKSSHSGMYIGVSDTDTSKVRQYATVTDYTLWKLIETSSGRYKICCKALESNGMVMALPATTSGNGVDLTNLVYTNDSSYNDEWSILLLSKISNLTMTRDDSRTANLSGVSYLSPCIATSFTYEVIYHPSNVSVDNNTGEITALKTGYSYIKAIHKSSKEGFVFKVTVRKDAIIIIPGIFGSELFIDGDQGNFKDGDHLITTEILPIVGMITSISWNKSTYVNYVKGSALDNMEKYTESVYDALSCYDNGNPKYNVYTKKYNPTLAASDGDKYTANCGTLNYYENLYDAFITNTQITDKYVVDFFSYDWRLSNAVSATKLNNYINSAGYGKVILIAHSMGGLVASGYLAIGETQRNKVDGVYMLASPLLGAPEVVNVWANLDVTFLTGYEHNPLIAEGLNFILSLVTEEFDAARSLISNYRSVYELLPTAHYMSVAERPYIKTTDKYLITSSSSWCTDYTSSKTAMADALHYFDTDLMDSAEDFHDSCYINVNSSANGSHVSTMVDTHYFYSTSENTLTQLEIEFDYSLSPIPIITVSKEVDETDGDSLVPYWSATIGLSLSNNNVWDYNNDHLFPIEDDSVFDEIILRILT